MLQTSGLKCSQKMLESTAVIISPICARGETWKMFEPT